MKTYFSTLLLLMFLSSSQTGFSQVIPEGGESIIDKNTLKSFTLNDDERGTMRIGKKDDRTGLILKTFAMADNPWDIQISTPTIADLKQGDILLMTFEGKMISSKEETGKASMNVVLERAGGNYDKSLMYNVQLNEEWTTFYLPFEAHAFLEAGKAQVNFQIGFKQQHLILANIQCINYKDKKKLTDLPRTKYTYDGREADAEWRIKANQQIDKHRKANLTINCEFKDAKLPDGYKVHLIQQKHEFGFGTAVDATTLNNRAPYREILLKDFNKVVFENDLKWPQWENEYNRQQMFDATDWLRKNKFDIRGHVLVWPSWRWLPGHLQDLKDNPVALQKAVTAHIKEEAWEMDGKLTEWDVLNEPFTNTDLQTICGEDKMIDWFNTTRKVDKKAILYINDFSIIGGGGTDKKHQDHYYKTIKYLVDNNAPVQGIGFQSHFGMHLTPPTEIWRILDRYSEFNLEMQVTEFDIDTDDDTLQADYTKDFMTAIFAYPKMKGLMAWGFWENRHWRPKAAMYRSDWTQKPNGAMWQELIHKTWWTDTTIEVNTKTLSYRAFKGEYKYEILNKLNEVVSVGKFTLSDSGQTVTAKLK